MISYDARIEKAVRSVCLMQIITFAVLLLSGCSNVQSTVEDSNKEEIDSETVMDAASETIFETPQIPEKHIKTITSYKNGTTSGTPSYFVELDQSGNPLVYYNYNDDGTVNWEDSLTYEYNAAGEMISKIYYIEDGSIVTKKEWEYDSEGNMTAERYLQKNYQYEKTYEYDSTGKLIASAQNSNYSKGSTRYEYDDSGNMTAEYSYNKDDNFCSKLVYEYDSDNNKTAEYFYNKDAIKRLRETWSYDANGNMLAEYSYDTDGSVDWGHSNTYEYDTDGNMTAEYNYKEDGTVNYVLSYEYDTDGNMTARYCYNDGEKTDLRNAEKYEYDANGNMTARYFYNGDGTIDWRGSNTMEYDSNGNKISEYYYDENGTVSDYFKREYDICGNCISKHHYYGDGSIISVENCVITYYD